MLKEYSLQFMKLTFTKSGFLFPVYQIWSYLRHFEKWFYRRKLVLCYRKPVLKRFFIYLLLQRNYFYVICKRRWKRCSSRFSG